MLFPQPSFECPHFIVSRKQIKPEATLDKGEAPALDIYVELPQFQSILEPCVQDGCFTVQQQKPGSELAQASLPCLPPSLRSLLPSSLPPLPSIDRSIYLSVIYLSIYLPIYVCLYVCMYPSIYVCMYKCIPVSMQIHLSICLPIYLQLPKLACLHAGMYVCVYTCIQLCIYIDIHTYMCRWTLCYVKYGSVFRL